MKNKVLIVVMSVLGAFVIGGLLGVGYFYVTSGVNVVSATPIEGAPAAKVISVEGLPSEGVMADLPQKEQEASPVAEEPTGALVDLPTAETDTDERTEAAPATPPVEEALAEKVAYLTIDDGPDPRNTPAVLDVLQEYGIKATFFVLGTSVEKYPELVRQIDEAGHVIGNHTYNHVYKDTYASDDSFWASVRKTEELVEELLGSRPTLVREPGGRFMTMPEKQAMVREEGYGLIHWNIDSYDSRSPIPDAQTIFANVKRQAEKEKLWPAMVLLFHDGGGHQSTVEALPAVIEYLLDEGFAFKTITEMDVETMADLPRP